jgi:predicted NAD/FAD-binding protein
MRIAIVGSGITGMSAAWALRDVHEVILFEKADRLGGHSNTLNINYDGTSIDVDTGFIVYNALNYPNLIALFDALDVTTIQSDMSFSVRDGQAGREWGSDGAPGFFAWKRNLLNPSHWGLLGDMLRFNKQAQSDVSNADLLTMSLGDYCRKHTFSQAFIDQYLMPMGAAIWSTPEIGMMDYPASSFIRFFNNHRLLHTERPDWRTVVGGSRRYVEKFEAALGDRVRLSSPVTSVTRTGAKVLVTTGDGKSEGFDQIIFACHSDQALAILADANDDERDLLGAVRFSPNVAVLHRDVSTMPQRKAAWASWNVSKGDPEAPIELTYWMNRLQHIEKAKPLFVTLNPAGTINPAKVFATIKYEHPIFDAAAAAAQRLFPKIQGVRQAWFAGAWQGYGFHEDGLRAGLRAALRLGGRVPWTFVDDDIARAEHGIAQNSAPHQITAAGL